MLPSSSFDFGNPLAALPLERKPQQQTLPIRISDELREFLERSRRVISNGRGEPVSISDIAKILLESARDDRLDFRLEVAELQDTPTESLLAIRRKWEDLHGLSRAEWIFLAQYIQGACEHPSGNSRMPAARTLVVLLEALLAVRALRADQGVGLDRYYLGNLGMPGAAGLNERQIDPQLVPQVIAGLIQGLRAPFTARKPTLAGRSFYGFVSEKCNGR
jgi:hypothetical protein